MIPSLCLYEQPQLNTVGHIHQKDMKCEETQLGRRGVQRELRREQERDGFNMIKICKYMYEVAPIQKIKKI